ncbi:MAG: enoyl-CoA hydratase [Chitinophagaceae bacterium]|nr:enoyl-CoA hydratase [Oligoflexus sp.]
MSSTSTAIRVFAQDGILEITIDRPERKNAFTAEMYAAFAAALKEGETSDAVKVVLVTGAGGNYSTGNDLQDFLQAPPTGEKDPVFQFLRAIAHCPKPIICAVEGFAVGVGMTMLLHADLVYAAPNAKFQLPFVNLGLVPEAGSSYLLPLLVGHLKASELCLLGGAIDAETALRYGLINAIVPAELLTEFAREKALTIAAKPTAAVQQTKALFKDAHRTNTLNQMKTEEHIFLKLLKAPETIERLKSFFTRKK